MIAGVLEIQMMADMARLSKDMNAATKVVSDTTDKMGKSVATLKDRMSSLGLGISIGFIADTTRRMIDSFTKMNAQIELSTKTQESYNTALADARRISTIAQTDITATTMLYTRLMNVMDGTGVSQQQLATVTETVAYGLKAYGATAQEAASASLQLSQAMGANRLGGEEFRAIMESMPNVMKVLADSMGVPLGGLRQLSMDGKITAAEMVKAFGDPAIAEKFKALALNAQTVTGAFVVAKNELTLLIGQFSKATGTTSGLIDAINSIGSVFRFLGDNINTVITAATAYAAVAGGKMVASLIAARAAAVARTQALIAETAATLAAARANAAYTGSLVEVAAAQAAYNAASIGWFGRLKGAVGKGGLIGLALFGVMTVVDILDSLDQVARKGEQAIGNLSTSARDMTMQQLVQARQLEQVNLTLSKNSIFARFNEADIRASEDRIRIYDAQIAKVKELEVATRRRGGAGATGPAMSHDELVMLEKANALLKQYAEHKLTEAEFTKRMIELRDGKEAPSRRKAKTEAEKQAEALQRLIDAADNEAATYDMTTSQIKVYEAALAGATTEQLMHIQAIYDQIAAMDEEKRKLKEIETANKEAADKARRDWEQTYRSIQSNMGTLLEAGLRRGFRGIGDAFTQMVERMMIEAAAANLTQALFGTAQGGGGGLLGSFGASVAKFFMPSFAGGGDTGPGARSGGLDGMGGFAAILHPNETVIDRSAGQSAQPSVTVVQHINIDSRTDQAVIMSAMQQAQRAAEVSIMNSLTRGGQFASAVGRA